MMAAVIAAVVVVVMPEALEIVEMPVILAVNVTLAVYFANLLSCCSVGSSTS